LKLKLLDGHLDHSISFDDKAIKTLEQKLIQDQIDLHRKNIKIIQMLEGTTDFINELKKSLFDTLIETRYKNTHGKYDMQLKMGEELTAQFELISPSTFSTPFLIMDDLNAKLTFNLLHPTKLKVKTNPHINQNSGKTGQMEFLYLDFRVKYI